MQFFLSGLINMIPIKYVNKFKLYLDDIIQRKKKKLGFKVKLR